METKEDKFRKIVDEYSEKIMRLCGYYAPSLDDQKDIHQEILINIWKSLDSFRNEAKIGTWIYRISVNTSLSLSGKQYKQMKCRVDMENMAIRKKLAEEEAEPFGEEQFQDLQSHLNQLNVIDKVIMGLVLDGQSSKEIADIVGISEPNVRVKIHRIKETLKIKMKGYQHETSMASPPQKCM